MSFRPIQKIEQTGKITDIQSWYQKYKEAYIGQQHDTSQLTLVLPDDSLVVFGPTRLSHATGSDVFYPVGFLSNLTYSETRAVQPVKAIGSRRHIFSATNAPVQVSIQRMMIIGLNFYRAMYAKATFGSDITDKNSFFAPNGDFDAAWFANAEEDLYRVPIGIGVLFNSPATLAGGEDDTGAVYIEAATLVSSNVSITSGQTMVLENISMMADRIIPWNDGQHLMVSDVDANNIVQKVSDMA